MPHSPRWYKDRLWVLNSGNGGIGWVDQESGQYVDLATLLGFTRGLAFRDRFAFVGLSQVRESAVLSAIKIAELPEQDRWSGVAVVEILSGECVAWLRFEGAVQEVFAVGILPDLIWPNIFNRDAEMVKRLLTDPHSPSWYRANGPVTNIDAFYTAFDVKEGDKLFKPSKERIRIW